MHVIYLHDSIVADPVIFLSRSNTYRLYVILVGLLQELFEGYYFCQAQREDFFQRAKPYKEHPTVLRFTHNLNLYIT